MSKVFITLAILVIALTTASFSGGPQASVTASDTPGDPQGVAADKGTGPFQNVTLAPPDKDKIKTGLSVFTNKCLLCHELDANKVGPPLRNATKTYSPEFILNMIVNPVEMQKSNATVKELFKKYNNVPMPDQKISQQDALAIYEYLRSVVK